MSTGGWPGGCGGGDGLRGVGLSGVGPGGVQQAGVLVPADVHGQMGTDSGALACDPAVQEELGQVHQGVHVSHVDRVHCPGGRNPGHRT